MEKQVAMNAQVALVTRAAKLMQAGIEGDIYTCMYPSIDRFTFSFNEICVEINSADEDWDVKIAQAVAQLDEMILREKAKAEKALAVFNA